MAWRRVCLSGVAAAMVVSAAPAFAQDAAPAPAAVQTDEVDARIAEAARALDAGKVDEADAMVTAALATAEARGPTDPAVARALGALARVRQEQGRYPEALDLITRALDIPRPIEGAEVEEAHLLYDRAKANDALGRNEEAEIAARRSYELRRDHLGQVQEKTADSLNLYANALTAQGRHAEADVAYRQVLGMYEVLYGPKEAHVAIVLSNLGNSLRRTGRSPEANPLYRRAVSIAEISGDKVLLAQCLTNYGWYLHLQGDGVKAEIQFRRALELALGIVGPDHPFTGVVRANIGYALADQNRHAEAEAEFAAGLALLEKGLGADSPDIVDTLRGYGLTLAALDRPDEAEAQFRRAQTINADRLAPAHPDALLESEVYAGFLLDQARPAEALGGLRTSLAALIGQQGGGRDWRTNVRGAGPLFKRRVQAAWALTAASDVQQSASVR